MPVKMLPCFAYTNNDPVYPGFVNIQHNADGSLTVTMRPRLEGNVDTCPPTSSIIIPAAKASGFDDFADERAALLSIVRL